MECNDSSCRALHFSYNPCHHHPCPNLTGLECRNINPTTLVSIIRLRAIADIPIKGILFDSDDPLTQDDFVNLKCVGVKLPRIFFIVNGNDVLLGCFLKFEIM